MTEATIENRLRDTSATCLDSYLAWEKDKKNAETSEALHSAVHELRKVASRLEIELAASERDNGGQRRLQPPANKAAKNHVADQGSEGARTEKRQRRPRKPKTDAA